MGSTSVEELTIGGGEGEAAREGGGGGVSIRGISVVRTASEGGLTGVSGGSPEESLEAPWLILESID